MGQVGRILPPKYNLVGQIFGYLEVIEMIRNETPKVKNWMCAVKCLGCANTPTKIVTTWHLMNGKITSCGCRRDQYEKTTGCNNKQFTGVGDMRGKFWSKMLKHAKNRNLEVTVTKEEAYQLFLDQNKKCALSNIPIQFGRSNWYEETTASLDRIDSSKGYIKNNIQWVHKDINLMKNSYDQEYFIKMCTLISDFNNKLKG